MRSSPVLSSFKLSAVAAMAVSLSACLGSGSNPVVSSAAAPTTTPANNPPATTPTSPAGVSISMPGTATIAAGGAVSNVALGARTIGNDVTLTTTGTVGRNNVGNVTSATVSNANASLGGTTLTLTHGVAGATVSNSGNGFWANKSGSNVGDDEINGKTAMPRTVVAGTYAPAEAHASYAYMTFGTWFESRTTTDDELQAVLGYYVQGEATNPANIPASGTASYAGNIQGAYFPASGAVPFDTHATLNATADFASRSLSFATSGSQVYNNYNSTYNNNQITVTSDAVPAAHLNMSGTLTYAAGDNRFSGAVTDGGGRSGTATGRFFGPAAQEIGGVFDLSGAGQGAHVGHFVGKQQDR